MNYICLKELTIFFENNTCGLDKNDSIYVVTILRSMWKESARLSPWDLRAHGLEVELGVYLVRHRNPAATVGYNSVGGAMVYHHG